MENEPDAVACFAELCSVDNNWTQELLETLCSSILNTANFPPNSFFLIIKIIFHYCKFTGKNLLRNINKNPTLLLFPHNLL